MRTQKLEVIDKANARYMRFPYNFYVIDYEAH
ncbi:hypothetical protein PsAD14_03308 [Pseudovibrio sp. Ad14]|nr:hypothetical protein PsW74_01393 [Pseudovibrio sp. W74]KZL08161.1 hypothetical protein PsAD14_03308 [Pseudovibrio sp. Ad14]